MKKCLLNLLLLGLLISCASTPKDRIDYDLFRETDSGLRYRITSHGRGLQPKEGELVTIHYVGTLEDGTVIDSTRRREEPFTFVLADGEVIDGMDEAVSLMRQGDTAEFIIPPELAYGERQVGLIPPNSTLHFEIELIDISPPIEVEPYDTHGKAEITTESGLTCILVEEGSGRRAAPGFSVKVHYTVYLEDGTVVDSSVKRDRPMEFTLGMGEVIQGWEEGIALMREGDRMRLIVPPELAYGEEGIPGMIPGNATLIFDIELLEID